MTRASYAAAAAWRGFWRNPVMSLASTFTVGLMLLLFGFFLATDRGLQAAVGVLESKVELAVYLDDSAKVSDLLAFRARIERDPAVSRVDYVTKEAALKRLVEIAERRPEIDNGVVEDVVDNPSVVDKLLTITRVLSVGGIAVLAMMLVVALFVIVNTIRVAVHARRDEIEIMKLVGATDWFVRWPFIL